MAPLFRSGVLGEHVFDLGQSGQELRFSVSALCRLSALSLFSSGFGFRQGRLRPSICMRLLLCLLGSLCSWCCQGIPWGLACSSSPSCRRVSLELIPVLGVDARRFTRFFVGSAECRYIEGDSYLESKAPGCGSHRNSIFCSGSHLFPSVTLVVWSCIPSYPSIGGLAKLRGNGVNQLEQRFGQAEIYRVWSHGLSKAP
ncbi:hypothetical protein F2Q69_00030488 [Brassica cretica]|uniref:Uncharacterized protein n=1 Tax=Brassica cretica TaxID=69181 RepID=A0A8S9S0I3_BRACR|nr:hypothetical protein F2Q69_00030488 [Brassica cretica]